MNLVNAKPRVEAASPSATKNVLVRVLAIAASGLALSGGAHAATTSIDTTDIVSTISGGVTAISAIGVAVISLVVVIKLYKWVQRVL